MNIFLIECGFPSEIISWKMSKCKEGRACEKYDKINQVLYLNLLRSKGRRLSWVRSGCEEQAKE